MIEYSYALDKFEIFILILMRIATFIYVAPIFNTSGVPRRVKIGVSFFISVLVFSINPNLTVSYDGVLEYAFIVLKEFGVGILTGLICAFCVQIILFAGKVIDMETGLSMAQIFDPTTRIQVGIFGNLYHYMLILLLLTSGLHRYLIEAIVETYKVIPIGKAVINASLYPDIIGFMSDYFVIGFRIALPVFACTILLNVVLAILARVSPQMNMFVVGMQLKIFVGIIAIFFTISMLPSVSIYIETETKTMLNEIVKGLTP